MEDMSQVARLACCCARCRSQRCFQDHAEKTVTIDPHPHITVRAATRRHCSVCIPRCCAPALKQHRAFPTCPSTPANTQRSCSVWFKGLSHHRLPPSSTHALPPRRMEEAGHSISPDQSMFLFLKLISRSPPTSPPCPCSSPPPHPPACHPQRHTNHRVRLHAFHVNHNSCTPPRKQ
jgi:hypothetical protein